MEMFEDADRYINPCIVLDISDTLIDKETGLPIWNTVAIYHMARANGIPVFIVSAREPYDRKRTYEQMALCGCLDVEDYYLVGKSNNALNKLHARMDIHARGYTILYNVGDADTDFYGGYYIYGIRVLHI